MNNQIAEFVADGCQGGESVEQLVMLSHVASRNFLAVAMPDRDQREEQLTALILELFLT